MQKLKAAYDTAQEDDKQTELLPKKGKSNNYKASSCTRLGELVKEVTKDEQTEPPLHEKVSSLVDSLLASGLNEPALLKWRENIRRPENSNFSM